MSTKAAARERQSEVVEFCKIAFDYDIDCDWPNEFRRWVATKYRIHHKEHVSTRSLPSGASTMMREKRAQRKGRD